MRNDCARNCCGSYFETNPAAAPLSRVIDHVGAAQPPPAKDNEREMRQVPLDP